MALLIYFGVPKWMEHSCSCTHAGAEKHASSGARMGVGAAEIICAPLAGGSQPSIEPACQRAQIISAALRVKTVRACMRQNRPAVPPPLAAGRAVPLPGARVSHACGARLTHAWVLPSASGASRARCFAREPEYKSGAPRNSRSFPPPALERRLNLVWRGLARENTAG